MRTLLVLSLPLIAACNGSASVVENDADASVNIEPSSLKVTEEEKKFDPMIEKIKESSRIIEECVMPAFGLRPDTQTCETPPAVCLPPCCTKKQQHQEKLACVIE